MKILLVEDNPGDARLVREALREVSETDFDLAHVDTLAAALAILARDRFDIVLLDLSLPDGRGLDLIRRMAASAPELPIVVLTGLNDEETALKALQTGAQDYLVKGQADGYLILRSMRYAIEREKIEQEMRAQQRQIEALHEIVLAASSSLKISEVLDVLLEKIDGFLPYAASSIFLWSEESRRLEPAACRNLDATAWRRAYEASVQEGRRGLGDVVFEMKAPLRVSDLPAEPRLRHPKFVREHGLASCLGVPMFFKGRVLGVLSVYTRTPHEFSDEEVRLLTTLASQAAIAIENSRLYEQAKRQATELERAYERQADFTAMIVHDLRSPLMNICGTAELMEQGFFGEVNEEQKKWLQRLQSNGKNLVNLISDFLDLSKLESGRLELNREEIDLRGLIDSTLENFQIMAKSKKIALQRKLSPALPAVRADARRLDQVLSNLVSNAIKFTSAGGSIEVGAAAQDGAARVWVKDTGVGIAPGEIATLFDKYRQSMSGKCSDQKGTGLGLVICKMIVEAHGGKIWAESEPGKGATFSFSLPLGAESRESGAPQ
jgi:signal transduction histidine kinase